MTESERKKMLDIPMVDEAMVGFLEGVGFHQIADMKGKTTDQVIEIINERIGYNVLRGPMVHMALSNLIDRAEGR